MCIPQDNSRRRRSLVLPITANTNPVMKIDPSQTQEQQQQQPQQVVSNLAITPTITKKTACSNPLQNKQQNSKHQTHFVKHCYHDHAKDIDDNKTSTTASSGNTTIRSSLQQGGGSRGGVIKPFPIILHEMLDKIDQDGLSHVISWQPHGRCFLVHKPKIFANEVMSKYFKQTKYTSFQRQLNLYGFNRLTRNDKDKGAYYHDLFLRGKVHLAHKMRRSKIKGTGTRGRSDPISEPDFYAMEPVIATSSSSSSSLPELSPSSVAQEVVSSTATTTTKLPQHDVVRSSDVSIDVEPTPLKDIVMSSAFVPHEQQLPQQVKNQQQQEEKVANLSYRNAATDYSSDDGTSSTSSTSSDVTSEGDDCLFEGQHFHYLESSMSLANTLKQTGLSSQPQPVLKDDDYMVNDFSEDISFDTLKQDDIPAPPPSSPVDSTEERVNEDAASDVAEAAMIDIQGDNDDPFTEDEMDELLNDVKIPNFRKLIDTIDDDVAFGNLLEKIIE